MSVGWRSPTGDDTPAIVALARRLDVANGTLETSLVDGLADLLANGGAGRARVAVDGIAIIGAGWARTSAGRDVLHVVAEPSRQDIERELLQWLVNTSAIAEAKGVMRVERVLVPETSLSRETLSLYERLGFAYYYTELEMSCGVTEVGSGSALEIVAWTRERHAGIREAYNIAFGQRGFAGHSDAEWERAFGVEDFAAEHSFVALEGDAIVGFVFGLIAGADGHWVDPAIRGIGWVDSVGVVPSHQRRGVASALVSRAVASFAATAERVGLRVNVDNAGAIAAYRRLGFEVVRVHVVYQRGA